jgi:hypothetical protein
MLTEEFVPVSVHTPQANIVVKGGPRRDVYGPHFFHRYSPDRLRSGAAYLCHRLAV